MSNKYKFHDPDGTYFITFSVLAECYDWSSAIDYTGGKGLVEIEML